VDRLSARGEDRSTPVRLARCPRAVRACRDDLLGASGSTPHRMASSTVCVDFGARERSSPTFSYTASVRRRSFPRGPPGPGRCGVSAVLHISPSSRPRCPSNERCTATWSFAISMSSVLRSFSLASGSLRSGPIVTEATDFTAREVRALATAAAAWRNSTGVGGVFKMNAEGSVVVDRDVNRDDRALHGLGRGVVLLAETPFVWMPCGPRAVPTGGAGVAPPASSWILTTATIFLAMVLSLGVLRAW